MKQFQTELPENYDALKKQANYTSSWRERYTNKPHEKRYSI